MRRPWWLKIYKYELSFYSLPLFLLMQVLFFYVCIALSQNQTVFNLNFLLTYLSEHSLLLSSLIIAFLISLKAVFRLRYLIYAPLLAVNFSIFYLYFDGQQNIFLFIFLLNFFFSILFYLTWRLSMNDASYAPNFDKNRLKSWDNLHLKAKLYYEDLREVPVYLSNYSEHGLFFVVKDKLLAKKIAVQSVAIKNLNIEVTYQEIDYLFSGVIISCYLNGFGMRIEVDPTTKNVDKSGAQKNGHYYPWKDLYEIIHDKALSAL